MRSKSTGFGPVRIAVALAIGLAASAMAWSPQAAAPASPQKPNIILIVADDLGYGGLGVTGDPEARTPNIDRLAAQGVRMTDYYANHPVCSPSRAALMTGVYQHRMGFENNSGAPRNTSPKFGVPAERTTLPEALKAAGYATGMFGKWHIGFAPDRTPTAQGFDTYYGFLAGAHAYVPEAVQRATGDGMGGEGRFGGGATLLRGTVSEPMPAHTTEAFGTEAATFIEANKDRPFFAYVAFNAVHAPMQTTAAYLKRYAHIENETRRIHLAQLAAMDDAVGRIVAAVDRNRLGPRTLIVFTSDNGGPTQETTSSNRPLNGVKGLVLEGGIRVPAIARWPGQIPAGRVVRTMSMSFDLTATAIAVAGAAPPPQLDGVNLMPFFTDAQKGDAHDALFWRSGEQSAVRSGSWKLVRAGPDRHLFNLAQDIGERNDLAAAEPARVKALEAQWDAWSAQMQPPAWVRNELSGGDVGLQGRARNAIARYVRGDQVQLDDEE